MRKAFGTAFFFLVFCLSLPVWAQNNNPAIFANDGEKVIYNVYLDASIQDGTLSDALQNVPGVKVDTEGQVTLRGVSAVVIWIDDRPSHFDDESRKTYLQQTAASSIRHIEVMTNPSARYTSDTDTGIINIISKDKKKSTRSLTVGMQTNTTPNFSPSVSYLWQNEKLAFTLNVKGNFSNNRKITHGWSCAFDSVSHLVDSTIQTLDTSHYRRYVQNEVERDLGLNVMLRLDYKINEKNDFSTYVTLNPSHNIGQTFDTTYRREYIHDIGEYNYYTQNDYLEYMLWGSAGVYMQHRFDKEGHNLSVNLNTNFDFGDVQRPEIRMFREQSWLNRDIHKRDVFTDIGWDGKIDYNLPLGATSSLYFGLATNFHPDNNICHYDTLNFESYYQTHEKVYLRDSLRSEFRFFNSWQNEALVVFQQRIGNLTIRPGMTYELMRIKANYIDTPQYNAVLFFNNWRPSLHLTYRTPSMHNFSLSYTRRTTYDWVRNFTKRINYSEDSFSVGNSDLQPTKIDVFEGGWAKYWKNFGSVSVKLYSKQSHDAINTVTESRYEEVFGRTVFYTMPHNIGKIAETGGELNFTYRPNALFNLRLDANLYDSFLKTTYHDEVEQNEMLCYNFRLNVWTKLWNKLELMGTAYYNSPTQTLYATLQTAYGINFGMRADFFNNRLSVLLNANDIFNWNKEDNNIFSPTYISFSTSKTNSRYVSLELIYKIL